MNDAINYELKVTVTNSASFLFQFHGDNLVLARDHAEMLVRDAKNEIKSGGLNFDWDNKPEGNIVIAEFRKIGTENWRKLI